jgi:ParB-like chromosome segregation protein Spo0J
LTSLALDKIKLDGGTQSRAKVDEEVVADYAQIIRDGTDLPPVVAFHDGKNYWLADGFHRIEAYRSAGAVEIEADVRQGTRRDAILFSVGANAHHGLQRTSEDKRRAVLTLLKDDEWSKWSDREIARQCSVGRDLVGDVRRQIETVRASLSAPDSDKRTFTTKHGTVSTMDTGKIGKSKPPTTEEQAEFERQRQEVAARLPDSIKASIAARDERAKSKSEPQSGDAEAFLDLIADKDTEIAELTTKLEEAIARLASLDDMVAEYERGGFEAVIAGLKEQIRVSEARFFSTNEDMAKWMKKARFEESEKLRYKAAAEKLGYSDDIDVDDIDPDTGAVKNG